MKVFALLLLYLTAGIGLIMVQAPILGLPQEFPQGVLRVWQESVELFAVPFVFLLFSWSKNSFFKWMRLLWAFAISGISFMLLWNAPTQFPQISVFGLCLIAFIGTLTLSLGLVTLFDLSQEFQGKQKKLRELLSANQEAPTPAVLKSQDKVFQRVEGA